MFGPSHQHAQRIHVVCSSDGPKLWEPRPSLTFQQPTRQRRAVCGVPVPLTGDCHRYKTAKGTKARYVHPVVNCVLIVHLKKSTPWPDRDQATALVWRVFSLHVQALLSCLPGLDNWCRGIALPAPGDLLSFAGVPLQAAGCRQGAPTTATCRIILSRRGECASESRCRDRLGHLAGGNGGEPASTRTTNGHEN